MFRGISAFRHLVVAIAVVGTGLLAFTGVLASSSEPERFDQWQTVVAPAGGDGLRITETIDQDFGTEKRRGHRRTIPNDYGVVTDIGASSTDAPDDLHVDPDYLAGRETEIRIGDPDVTISGQHRYVLDYRLPDARVSTGFLALDIIGGLDFETGLMQVVVTGFDLDNPRCFVGRFGSMDPCEIAETADGTYVANIDTLRAGFGVTIDGVIVGTGPSQDVAPLPLPARRDPRPNALLGLLFGGIAAVSSVPYYFAARRQGRNQVLGSGAADAAYGELPPPGFQSAVGATRMVTDQQLVEMATIEFEPPRGIAPWEGAVLLNERIDGTTTPAYLSSLAGAEGIELDEVDRNLQIRPGTKYAQLAEPDRAYVDRILAIKNPYVTGTYDKDFATIWRSITPDLRGRVAGRGWWRSGLPDNSLTLKSLAAWFWLPAVLFAVFGASASLLDVFRGRLFAVLFAIFVPLLVAYFAYRRMLPSRTAAGSALALRTESFRRFLEASEARHVEWAWERGVLREYSAWAVALGEATAWSRALAGANIPEPARVSTPLYIYTARSSFASTTSPPSSSDSGGGGGFSGGSVGGGGGGGGGGSW